MGILRKAAKAAMGSPSCPNCNGNDVRSAGSFEQRGKVKSRNWFCYDCGHNWATR